jgi:pantoate--beta-alanine ligase
MRIIAGEKLEQTRRARNVQALVHRNPSEDLMQKIESLSEMRSLAATFKAQGKSIALIPTQGALHTGQEVLIRAATQKADVVIVSLFVNPLQFPANEIPANYPRSLESDLALCASAGAHVVFTPITEEFYPRGFSTYVSEEATSRMLCGPSRPTHFRGVTTMAAKLFNLIQPKFVFFGQKTVQRAGVVRKMIEDLGYEIEVVVVPTAREPDGLAAGVRNKEFTSTMRQESLAIHAALKRAKEMVEAGVRSPDRLIAEATHLLGERRKISVIYVSIVDLVTMEPVRDVVPGSAMLAIAAWVDEVRLIDNAVL